jgi:hypothetical protein
LLDRLQIASVILLKSAFQEYVWALCAEHGQALLDIVLIPSQLCQKTSIHLLPGFWMWSFQPAGKLRTYMLRCYCHRHDK